MAVNFQLVGGDIISNILWFVLLMVFFSFYPRIMISQMMWRLDKTMRDIESMSDESKIFVLRQLSQKPDKKVKESVNRFFEFFTIMPVSLDPSGIVKRFDHLLIEQKNRFSYFVEQIDPNVDKEKKANLEMGFAAAISLYDVSKVVRHYVEIVRKTKNLQIAMMLQMQLPFIEKIAKSLLSGTKTLVKGEPIGDGLGPLAAASLMTGKTKEIEEDIVVEKIKLNKRNVFVIKSKGPGGRLGYPGKAVSRIAKSNKITKIISIDAAAKLEGEKTGSIAEGVGVAMGGIGVERSYIEEAAVESKIPLDSIVVKMSQEEAIMPMRKAVKDALPEIRKAIDRSLETTKPGSNVIILGVGNTSGVGNSKKSVEIVSKWVDRNEKKVKAEEKAEKKSWF